MKCAAQAGLEYLMTYGWALVLVATIVGVFVMIVGTPASTVSFSSSDQAKIMLKGSGIASDGKVEVIAQNTTGGAISVIGFFLGGDFVDRDADADNLLDAKLNGTLRTNIGTTSPAAPLGVPAGGTLTFKGITYVGPGDVDGLIEIVYKDFAGFQRRAIIRGKGKANANGTALTVTCPQTINAAGLYYIANDPPTAGEDCITINANNVVLNCRGKTLKGSGNSTGIEFSFNAVTITNCVISTFYVGISIDSAANSTSINSNTISNNPSAGIAIATTATAALSNNSVCGNNNWDVSCSLGTTGSGNRTTKLYSCSNLFNTSPC